MLFFFLHNHTQKLTHTNNSNSPCLSSPTHTHPLKAIFWGRKKRRKKSKDSSCCPPPPPWNLTAVSNGGGGAAPFNGNKIHNYMTTALISPACVKTEGFTPSVIYVINFHFHKLHIPNFLCYKLLWVVQRNDGKSRRCCSRLTWQAKSRVKDFDAIQSAAEIIIQHLETI